MTRPGDGLVDQVKTATNIVTLIGEYVRLKKSGQKSVGLCPFHEEKTPSFIVWEEIQSYKCFGCGETGDAFTFIRKYERCSFPEALRFLAERAGISIDDAKPVRKISQTDVRSLSIECAEHWRRRKAFLLSMEEDLHAVEKRSDALGPDHPNQALIVISCVRTREWLDIQFAALNAATPQELMDLYMVVRTPARALALLKSARHIQEWADVAKPLLQIAINCKLDFDALARVVGSEGLKALANGGKDYQEWTWPSIEERRRCPRPIQPGRMPRRSAHRGPKGV